MKRIKDQGLIEIAADENFTETPANLADAFAAKRRARQGTDEKALDQDLAVARDASSSRAP